MHGQLPIQTTHIQFNWTRAFSLLQSCILPTVGQRVPLSSIYAIKPFSNAPQPIAGSQREPDALVKIYHISNILVTRLTNGVRKNADGGLYNRASGAATMFPGVVVEVGYRDSLKKSR